MIEALKDKVGFGGKGAAIAVGKIGEPAVEPLIQFLKDENIEMKKMILFGHSSLCSCPLRNFVYRKLQK